MSHCVHERFKKLAASYDPNSCRERSHGHDSRIVNSKRATFIMYMGRHSQFDPVGSGIGPTAHGTHSTGVLRTDPHFHTTNYVVHLH